LVFLACPAVLASNRSFNFSLEKSPLKALFYTRHTVLRTNADLDTDVTALAYKDLWRVERAFRNMKSILDLRPVYHYKDSRVRGHIMVCFLALVLESAK
jgi:transposase